MGAWRYPFPLLGIAAVAGHWMEIQKGVKKGYFSGPDFVSQPKGPIKSVWFHERWVPIVDDQSGNYLFSDLAPEKGGKRGQIIEFRRESGATRVVAEGLTELLARVAKELEFGKYSYDKKTHALLPVSKPGRGQ
jgi:cell wall assembly regulator SMI1